MKVKPGDKVKILKDSLVTIKHKLQKDEVYTVIERVPHYEGVILISNGRHMLYVKEDEILLKTIQEKEKRFLKKDLKDGDIVTLRCGKKAIVKAPFLYIVKSDTSLNLDYYNDDFSSVFKDVGVNGFDIIKVERSLNFQTVYEEEKQILDDVEKRYLEAVLKPFKKDISSVTKEDSWVDEMEFIRIYLKDFSAISFPIFKKNTMYQGMENSRKYSVTELGLFS